MCRCGVGLNPLKNIQGRESTSLCHGQIRKICYICYINFNAVLPSVLVLPKLRISLSFVNPIVVSMRASCSANFVLLNLTTLRLHLPVPMAALSKA